MMHSARLCGVVSMALLLAAAPGCGKKNEDVEETKTTKKSDAVVKTSASARTELNAPLNGVIRGRVALEGDLPAMSVIEKMVTHNDHAGRVLVFQ